jgi:hypothetical protein
MNEIVAWPLPVVALTEVGVPGTVAGIIEFDVADVAPTPTPFVAVTVNV